MRAGRLRASITVQRQATTQDSYGQRNNTWTTLLTTRASIEPISGREFFLQSGEQAEVSTRIRLRYSVAADTIRPSDRIAADGKIYNIHAIMPDPKSRELLLMCVYDAA